MDTHKMIRKLINLSNPTDKDIFELFGQEKLLLNNALKHLSKGHGESNVLSLLMVLPPSIYAYTILDIHTMLDTAKDTMDKDNLASYEEILGDLNENSELASEFSWVREIIIAAFLIGYGCNIPTSAEVIVTEEEDYLSATPVIHSTVEEGPDHTS